jgi:hypothetical protein
MFSSTIRKIGFRRNFRNLEADRIYQWQSEVFLKNFNVRESGREEEERTNLNTTDNNIENIIT